MNLRLYLSSIQSFSQSNLHYSLFTHYTTNTLLEPLLLELAPSLRKLQQSSVLAKVFSKSNTRCPSKLILSQKHISRSLFQDIEGGEEGEPGDPPIRIDDQTVRVWAEGRPHILNIPLKYQVCK